MKIKIVGHGSFPLHYRPMSDALDLHRFQFAFTVSYHYLFPQLTMGLSFLLFVLKTMEIRGNTTAPALVRFWSKILGLSFVMGVVTGIPMEFQFGTNWSRFSAASGSIVGQTLAMEGVFAFFLESMFLYLFLFQEKRLGPKGHWFVSLLIFFGTWLSGYFIVCTNAWMQHPVAYDISPEGKYFLTSLPGLLGNPWVFAQYTHTMLGSVVTASFVMAGISAFYALQRQHENTAHLGLKLSVTTGLFASILVAFPTGDLQAKNVYHHQPVTFAAMEGHFHTQDGAGLVLIGQPDLNKMKLDNPIVLPKILSFLTHDRWNSEIKGLSDFPKEDWPRNVELLYYSYHIMAGLGTLFILLMCYAFFSLLRKKITENRALLWTLMLAMPFPFIANTTGWMTAELGRQPWIIYGLMKTHEAHSQQVSAGNVLFSLLGFMGLYVLLSILYMGIFLKILREGPEVKPV